MRFGCSVPIHMSHKITMKIYLLQLDSHQYMLTKNNQIYKIIYLYVYTTFHIYIYIHRLSSCLGQTCYQFLLHPSCRCICHGQRHKNGLARHCRSLGLERRRRPIQSFAFLTAAKTFLFTHLVFDFSGLPPCSQSTLKRVWVKHGNKKPWHRRVTWTSPSCVFHNFLCPTHPGDCSWRYDELWGFEAVQWTNG